MDRNNSCRGRALRIALGITIMVLLMVSGASAATLTVDDSGGGAYTRIQDAINNATAGDTIRVYSGTYDEYLQINKQLIIKWTDIGSGKPVINYTGTIGMRPVEITANDVTFKGFNITNFPYRYGSDSVIGIHGVNNTTIENNIVSYNGVGGVYTFMSNNNIIRNNTFSSNNGLGIYLSDSNNNTIINNNVIFNNMTGIGLNNTNYNNITGNNVLDNIRNGIYLFYCINNTILNNNVSNNLRYGINVGEYSNNSTITGNYFINNSLGGLSLSITNDSLIYNNFFNNSENLRSYGLNEKINWNGSKSVGRNIINGSNMGGNFWANPDSMGFSQTCIDVDNDEICDDPYVLDTNNTDYLPLALPPTSAHRIITVNASGGADYTRIQDAIDNATAGDTIVVYSGTYFENVNVTKQLTLKGVDTGSGKPVVDADGIGNPITLSADWNVIEGFAVTNSEVRIGAGIWINSNNNTLSGINSSSNHRHGIYLNGSNNKLSNSIVTNNDGIGIMISTTYNNSIISNFVSNNNMGIHLSSSINNNITGNNILNNRQFGFKIQNTTMTGFYNNQLNNTINLNFSGTVSSNNWNTTKALDTNIMNGPYLGGNFWASPDGTGFSQTCINGNGDGICDSPYVLDANNIDYLPLAMNSTSTGRVHNINQGTNYLTIQSAINTAAPGDEIHVYSGTYYENVNVTKQLTLKGVDTGAGKPVVDAGGIGNPITLSADWNVIEGLAVTNSDVITGAGIWIKSNNNTLSGINSSSNHRHGIYINGSNNKLINSIVANNDGIGIMILSITYNNSIISNFVSNNNMGIHLSSSLYNNITGNNILNNRLFGFKIQNTNTNRIYNNQLNNTINLNFSGTVSSNNWNITKALDINIMGGPYFGGNFWASPDGTGFSQTCTDTDGDGICDSAYILDANNTDFLPLSLNFTSTGRVHNINKGTNYNTIQSSIDDANLGDEIHVDSGTYYENVNVTKQLTLKGVDTGAGKPVVDAREIGSAIRLSADWNVIEGFTLTNSNDSSSAGIWIKSNNSTLSGITSSNNHCHGIYLKGNNNKLINNIVTNNDGIGILISSSTNNIIAQNFVSNNFNGIRFNSSQDNNITGNTILNNTLFGFQILNTNRNIIYNNKLNNTINFYFFDTVSSNNWNTTKLLNTNIMDGSYLGGNFWASPDGTGFSQTCIDGNGDGICDSPYVIDSNNTDFLPLASPDAPLLPSEIHGKVFNDINGNRIMDLDESGIPGVEIRLTRMISPESEFLAGIISTDLNGDYNFTGISSGYYRIEEFPVGSVQTTPTNGIPQFVTLGVEEIKTGVYFGNQPILPSEIHGIKFNDSNSNGIMDDGETGMSGISICLSPSWRCTTTDSSGNYSFSEISPGNYIAYEYLSSEYVATTPTMVQIIINSGEVRVVNFGSRLPVSPPSDVSVAQQSGSQNGVPTVFRPALTVLTISKNLTNIIENAVSVNLTMNWSDGASRMESMVNNSNVWTADFNAPFPGGTAQMRFEVDVAPAGKGPEDAIQIGDIIFIDPSGMIKNACTDESINNATVTLLVEYPPGTNNFIESPPENQIPEDNPLITGGDGRYSWLTIPGTYKVRAEKTGYEYAESDPVSVPPPVFDLNISLTPTGGCALSDTTAPDSVKDLRNISYASSYINWTWTEPSDADFAKVIVYLDGVHESDVLKGIQYYNASVAPGTYTIGTRTVDTSGNINATMVTHTATTILPQIRFINGTVIDSVSKEVISGVTVSASSLSTSTNATGFYSLAVASGSYDLKATFDVRYYTNSSITVSTVGNAVVVQDIELVKKPTGNITGVVTNWTITRLL